MNLKKSEGAIILLNRKIPDIEDTTSEIICFWVSKLGGFSIICSFYLISKILLHCERRKKIYHRIVLALSINSVLLSGAVFCHSWPIPRSYTIHGAVGTQGTCNAQGAVFLFSNFASSSYYPICFALAISSVWDKFDEIRFLKFELIVHASIYILPTILVAVALKLGSFNPGAYNQCMVATYPQTCNTSGKYGKCIRGGSTTAWLSKPLFLVYVTKFMVVFVLFILLVISIRVEENRNPKLIDEEGVSGMEKFQENVRKKKSRIKVSQASICWASYVVKCGLPIGFHGVSRLGFEGYVPDVIMNVQMFFLASDGCLILLVYLLLSKKKQNPSDLCMQPSSRDIIIRTASTKSRDRTFNSSKKKRSNSEGGEDHMQTCFAGPEFSIFDGTNPSNSRWGQFIDKYTDDDYDINSVDDQEEKGKTFQMDITDDLER